MRRTIAITARYRPSSSAPTRSFRDATTPLYTCELISVALYSSLPSIFLLRNVSTEGTRKMEKRGRERERDVAWKRCRLFPFK